MDLNIFLKSQKKIKANYVHIVIKSMDLKSTCLFAITKGKFQKAIMSMPIFILDRDWHKTIEV